RERLELVLAVREFARGRLGLRAGDSYTTFAEVPRDATVYVVSAARRDRLEAYDWGYPLVGRLPYRGFFSRTAAERAAGDLAAGAWRRGCAGSMRPPRRPRSASACGSAWRGPRRRRSRAGAPADATTSSRRTTRACWATSSTRHGSGPSMRWPRPTPSWGRR